MVRCGAVDDPVGEGDEADWHECDRVFDHDGDHNCHCAHAWPRPERPIIGKGANDD